MKKSLALLLSFILLTQIASFSFDEIRPEIERGEFLQGDENWEVSGRNNTSCGSDPSLTDLWASTDSSTWGTWTNAVYGYYNVNCTIAGNNYTLEATITESAGWSSYSFWNWTETNDYEYMSEAWSNLSAGSYCVNATLWEISGGASNYVDSDYPCFTLSSNNTGGNNTGGNNTGGNNTGGNNTGGNNTGGNNTGGNNTGGNNTSGCGTDPSLTDLWASTDSSTWGTWTNAVYGYYNVNCTIAGNNYTLEATITESAGWSSYSFWNWTETNDYEYMSEAWSNLSAGSYCVNATLWEISGGASNYVDSDYPCFTLSSNNTGGNNTGGNNTGGNNTGGNNTGGNNTGGNNTGGNNTGGNNTVNDCTNSTQTIDGWLSFVGIDSVYSINSPFGGEMYTCWTPGQESMSLTAWLNSSTGSVIDVQAYSGSNFWSTSSGAQSTSALDGNWMFPIHQAGSIFGMDYAPLNIPAGDYCFEGLLKVYDGNTFVHVDHQTACFTVVDSSVGPSPCAGGNDTYPTGLEWITVNPVSTMSSGVVGLGDPVANHFEIGGLSNAGDCNATYKFAFNLVRLSGGTGGSGVEYAYPSDSSMSATGICVGTTTCQFDIVKYPSEGCYTVHASLYSYPANQLLTNDQWEWWQVGNVSCGATNTPPEITSVVISPSSPLETDVLVCSYVFSDADNDPDNSLFTWTINGVPATSTSAILDSGYSDGDFVTCAVLAYDGIDTGNIGTSTVLVDSNTSGGSSGGLPSIGVIGTLAAISLSFIAVIRREQEE